MNLFAGIRATNPRSENRDTPFDTGEAQAAIGLACFVTASVLWRQIFTVRPIVVICVKLPLVSDTVRL